MSAQPWGIGWLPTNPDRCSCGRAAVTTYSRSDGHLIGYCGVDGMWPEHLCVDSGCVLGDAHDARWCAERLAMPRRMHAECLICDATTQPLPHEIVPPRGTP